MAAKDFSFLFSQYNNELDLLIKHLRSLFATLRINTIYGEKSDDDSNFR